MEWTDEQKENILRHYPSIEEYERIRTEREAKEYLANTDYIVIKAYEYNITGEKLDKDYTDIFKEREKMREILRNLKPTISDTKSTHED